MNCLFFHFPAWGLSPSVTGPDRRMMRYYCNVNTMKLPAFPFSAIVIVVGASSEGDVRSNLAAAKAWINFSIVGQAA
jgi:hypothetical protein